MPKAKKKTQKEKDAELKEKAKQAKEKAEAEAEAEAESEAENEAESNEAEDGDGDTDSSGNDDDADQDIALIKKMLKDYLGDDHGLDQDAQKEMEALAKEAYEAHVEMKKKPEEAYKCAGEAVKLAHHMAKKQAESKEAGEDDQGDDHADDKKKVAPKKPAPKKDDSAHDHDDDGDHDDAESESEAESESKESEVLKLKKQLLEATGRIATLETETKKAKVSKHVETTLRKSGLPMSVTKLFLETAGEFKSEKDFDGKWNIFKEGMKHKSSEVVELDFSVFTEKSKTKEDGGKEESKDLDFSNCVKD